MFKRSDQNIEITCQNNYVLRENEMAGEGRIVFVSFWFFVRNFHTNCDVDCIKNIKYDLFFLRNAELAPFFFIFKSPLGVRKQQILEEFVILC